MQKKINNPNFLFKGVVYNDLINSSLCGVLTVTNKNVSIPNKHYYFLRHDADEVYNFLFMTDYKILNILRCEFTDNSLYVVVGDHINKAEELGYMLADSNYIDLFETAFFNYSLDIELDLISKIEKHYQEWVLKELN